MLMCPKCESDDIEQIKHTGYFVCSNCYFHSYDIKKFKLE